MKLIKTEDAVGHVLCHDLTQIIKERGAVLVVDLREVVYVDPKIDITQDAITKMDAAVKTIAVTKVNLPDKPAGSGAAQQ